MPEQSLILLADDCPEDIFIIREAFERAHVANPIYSVSSGEEAISYLKGEGLYSNRVEYPLPDLLLLDLKMPRVDGFDVLRWIRQHSGLGLMRVVVLTSSDQLQDVNEAYRLGANSFMVKPADFENFIELGKAVQNYWLRQSQAPHISRGPKTSPAADWRPPSARS
jgi:CheY-like chemotaxis protein